MKIKLINKLLLIFSILLILVPLILFFLSILTLINLFIFNIFNIKILEGIQKSEMKIQEITIFNPGPLKIKNLTFDFSILIFNKTIDFLKLETDIIEVKKEKRVSINLLNKTLLEDEIKDYVIKLIGAYKDPNEIKNKVLEEINNPKLKGFIAINIEDILKISFIIQARFPQYLEI
ncbi:MAG: hypothetical protein QXH68_00550 [Candidatus Aenigmatarchaeota archaeon]